LNRLVQALHEAGILLAVATALGLIYTASNEKGLFARSSEAKITERVAAEAPPMISLSEAWNLYQSGDAVFVDARHEFDFRLGHITGAINVPLREYEVKKALLSGFPKNKLIVAYCDGAECNSSIELSVKLMQDGYTDVKIFFGGWREWEDANHPTEKSP
jgi:rhodanese-related sulfurtransferase